MRRLRQLVPSWRGRVLYLPPLTREWRRSRIASASATGLAIFWWAFCARGVAGALLVGAVLALGPVTYLHSWRIWDLLVWDSESPWKTLPPEQDANYEAASEAVVSLMSRRPEAVRAALGKVSSPSPWRTVVDLYYLGLADLMEGRPPAVEDLAEAMGCLDPGPRYDSARVMLALIEAGSANLAGGDWRTSLITCRTQLGLGLSMRRVIWPMQFVLLVMTATFLLVAAYSMIAW